MEATTAAKTAPRQIQSRVGKRPVAVPKGVTVDPKRRPFVVPPRLGRAVLVLTAFHAGVIGYEKWLRPGDWPGWRGPERTGVSAETGLLKQWPKGGPKLLWKATGLGAGYSTPSVAGGRLFTMGSRGDDEFLLAGRGGMIGRST